MRASNSSAAIAGSYGQSQGRRSKSERLLRRRSSSGLSARWVVILPIVASGGQADICSKRTQLQRRADPDGGRGTGSEGRASELGDFNTKSVVITELSMDAEAAVETVA